MLDPVLPPDPATLANPAQNYAAYRQHYREYPGLPFLLPHLRDRQQQGDATLQPLLQYLQTSPIER